MSLAIYRIGIEFSRNQRLHTFTKQDFKEVANFKRFLKFITVQANLQFNKTQY